MFFLGKWQGRLTLSLWREYPVTWCHYTQDSYENKPQKHLCGSGGLKDHVSWVTGICSRNVRIESGGRIPVERAMRSTLLLRRRSPGRSPTILTASSLASLCVLAGYLGCAATKEVKPTCIISWDQSADGRIEEYRVTVWMVSEGQSSDKLTRKVKAPATQVSCQEVGANTTG